MSSNAFQTSGNGTCQSILQTPSVVRWSTLLVVSPVLMLLSWYFISYHTSPLKRYPGPWLAGWTNLWRFWLAVSADHAPTVKRLHEKHGPVVRIGPNLLDLDFPDLCKIIYSTDGKWLKSDMYKNSSTIVDGKITYHMFSELDTVKHAKLKRPVVRHYSVPSVRVTEPLMDKTARELCDCLQSRFVEPGKVCPFGDWLAYYAWDVLGIVTFSKKFGYLEAGRDFDGSMSIGDQSIDYLGICGQMPWLDYWLDKNPIYSLGPPNLSNVTTIAVEHLMARLKGEDRNFNPEIPDFLQYFIDSKEKHPDVVDESTIIGYLLLNLIAGADTTAISLKALFYHCLKDRAIWSKLEHEVRENFTAGQPVPISEARQLPYLEAVVNETLRYHPPVSMIMERVVPEGGLTLPDGSVVPPGTLVGMNPYIVGRNKDLFGSDADDFRPERWLKQDDENKEAFADRIRQWSAANLVFGGGSRICLGRHLSIMEIYKIVPTLIATFDIELDDPNEVWWTSARWFYRVKGVVCKLKVRAT